MLTSDPIKLRLDVFFNIKFYCIAIFVCKALQLVVEVRFNSLLCAIRSQVLFFSCLLYAEVLLNIYVKVFYFKRNCCL